jgi:transcriptional regulator NrdR family protein
MQPFLYTKLLTDILAALTKRENRYIEATEITNTVIRNLLKQKTSATVKANTISLETAKVLKRFDKQSWHRYWAEHLSA